MKYLLIAILSLVVAVVLGHFISDDAGFVVIGYGGKVFRTSFAFFVVLLVVGSTAAYFSWRLLYQLLTLKTRWLSWTGEYRRKRSQRALSNGLMALAEGNFSRAEHLLSRGADSGGASAIHYLGAAEAAQGQDAADRRDTYLSLARDAMPSAEVAIGIKRVEMQLATKQYEQARATSDYLADRHSNNKHVLDLQQRATMATGDVRGVLGLLPALRRHRVYDEQRLDDLERETAVTLLSSSFSSLDDLHGIWHRLSKAGRKQVDCLVPYARHLTALGYQAEAENLLRKTLMRHWSVDLVSQYGEVRIPNAALQLERAEAWLITRTDDAALLLTVAKLSLVAEEWEKARTYLERLVELAPSPMVYRLLAEVHEHAEDVDAANLCQREGLRLATNAGRGLPAVRA